MTTNDQNTPAHDHQPSALCNVRKAGSMGSLLRSLAGTPAGWRPTRRGSFLVLVVGTLALLAVMAIIYSSIGNHDVRMKAAVAKHERLEDAPEQIKNYILSIIGDSVTATFYDTKRGLTNQPVLLSRVTFDFPYTDWTRRSDSGATLNPATAFNPTGSVTGFLGVPDFSVLDANQMPAKWIPSTPWLADSEPTYLNYLQTPIAPGDLDKIHQFRHDWGHLTNIAPDGRFINLYNLRGNWAAVSGIGAGETSDNVGYIYNITGNQLTNNSDFGDVMDNRFPAFMDSRQRWLFRPAGNTLGLKPNDVRYEPYLFADADGDGMYDSRWQELVDARQAVLKNYLNVDSRYRYVVATRIVDLSSMVNVNTATDAIAPPSAGAPVGMSPADVDLRGLLTGQAPFLSTTLSTGVGLDAIPQPATASPANYVAMDQVNSFIIGRDAYTSLRLSLASGVVPPADNTLYSGPALASNFEAQYGLAATDHDYSTEPVRRGDYYKNAGSALQSAVHVTTGTAHTAFIGRFGTEDLLELVTRRGVNDPTVTSSLELTLAGRSDPVNPLGPGIPDQHSPLRSNRPLEFELARYTFPGLTVPAAAGSAYDRTMALFNADSRQRLTTESGARQFRNAPSYYTSSGDASINAYQLGTNELRIDPKPALKAILAVDQAGFPRDVPNLVTAYQAQQANRHAQTNKIFQAYVSALAPRLGFDSLGAWAQNGYRGGPRATEFYGYRGPEMAIRTAGHLTANLIDAFDSKNTPTVHTLLLDGSFASTIDGYGPATPEALAFSSWRDMPTTGNPVRGLQLPTDQLADVNNGAAPKAPAINIFGVEAQPFITQVASFTVYADKDRPPASDGEGNSSNEATIDGDIGFASNPDLMYRVLAFQIHNPFGSPLDLGGRIVPESELYNVQDPQFPRLDREDSYFYLKVGDKEFKLGSLVEQVCLSPAGATAQHNSRLPAVGDGDAGSTIAPQPNRPIALSTEIYATVGGGVTPLTLEPITIPAGKTVVVYALSDAPKEILARMSQLNTNAGSAGAVLNETVVGSKKYTDFRNIIRQAIERNLGVSSADISGVYWIPEVDTSAGRAIIPTQTNYVPDGATTVELWRALRSGPDARSAVERLPNTYWDGVTTPAPRPGGPALTAAVPNDRRNDQLVDRFRIGASTRPEGLNAKLPPGQNQIQGSDATDNDKLYMATTWAVFSRHGNPGGTRPPMGALPAYCVEPKFSTINSDEWNQSVAWSVPASPLNVTSFAAFGAPPDEGFAESVAAWAFNMAANEITGNRIAEGPNQLGSPFPPATINATDRPYEENYPEIALANNDMEETVVPAADPPKRTVLRPADLLLPLGIGPEEMPIDASGNPVTDLELRWTTLGEAMALSMGYQINPNPGPDPDVTDPLAPAGPDDQWPLDRGQLRLDRFAPFYDVASDGTFDPATDERMGLQIPLALNILDTFTINPVDPATSGWETLKRPTPGTLNINTISLMTMRSSLPLLSPPPNTDPTGQPAWWWNGANPGPHNQSADLAASVFAYRSKGEAYLRPVSYLPSTSPYPFSQRVFFNDEDPSGAPVKPNSPETDFAGRSVTSGVPAVHEYPGFRSVGELLAVRYREGAGSEGWPSSMDYLAHDNALAEPGWAAPGGLYPTGASGRVGVDSILYPDPAGGPGPKVPSNIKNSYKEQLSIINGLLPSVSTRSDYFCVWFLVHGYQKSDCEGLGIDDPLVPSIARRFVMVVDRSKVTKKGDLPEVLLFKEVPVDPMPR